jgi:7-carboxy-7-deazaguanine synthase
VTGPTTPAAAPLIVAEWFGPTVQGEGPSTGRLALFIRLSRCNLSCSWCDTPYTWDWTRFDPRQQSQRVPADRLAWWALGTQVGLVVVTGGEPLIQQPAVISLARMLNTAGRQVHIETNGTIAPHPALVSVVDQFVVSPKLANSGVGAAARINLDVLSAFAGTGKAVFKFVVAGVADLDEIAELTAPLPDPVVWVMPEGVTADAVTAGLRAIADPVIARGWNLTARLHVLAWGNERGR